MASFSYQARDSNGDQVSGTVAATTIDEASHTLRGEGKFIIKLQPASRSARATELPPSGRVKRTEVILFIQQLAVMLETGVPMSEGGCTA